MSGGRYVEAEMFLFLRKSENLENNIILRSIKLEWELIYFSG